MKISKKATAPRYKRDDIESYLLVSEKTCESKRLTTTIVEMQPGGIQRVHSHEPEQMYYILEGEGMMVVADEEEHVTADDCIFFPSNTPHGLKNTGAGVLRYLSAASPSFTAEQSDSLWPLPPSGEQ
ncbi:MAG: cupin domain-containing protein [Deltaproteobacteria bacterium]|nr:cupin domain-containing protein [Deltaproteobacteria bacterium]